jgi:exonuclease III
MDPRNNSKAWNVLCWNISGLNAESKWESLKNKVTESQCDVVCILETKGENFDTLFIKLFCPSYFDSFCFIPSVGVSGGILIVWKGAIFDGVEVFRNNFALSIEFTSCHDNSHWVLTNVYSPCDTEGKRSIMDWFGNISMSDDMC